MAEIVERLSSHAGLFLALVAGAIGLWLMMPRVPDRRSFRLAGGLFGIIALVAAGVSLARPSGVPVADALFYVFAAVAMTSGALMITSRNPVYAALWFALTTLSVCGVFLLRSAPFLAAATIIVYAGAIVVTFLFVIMLARQHGAGLYDLEANRPLPAIIVTFALLGGLLVAIGEWRKATFAAPTVAVSTSRPAANPLSRPDAGQLGTMRGLGRSLFGDYLFAVELAGTLLLVGAIGAIAIAPRRSRGTL
jgi:NADH-quinone oxidoreductase subunit J